jgi:hypothetical protein
LSERTWVYTQPWAGPTLVGPIDEIFGDTRASVAGLPLGFAQQGDDLTWGAEVGILPLVEPGYEVDAYPAALQVGLIVLWDRHGDEGPPT